MSILPPAARMAIGAMVLAAGLFFAFAGALRLRDAYALGERGARTTAVITGERAATEDGGTHVRYRFAAGGATYTATGVFGTEVGVELDPDELVRARRTGAIEVVYLPDRPAANAPASGLGDRRATSFRAIVVGALLSLFGAAGVALAWRATRRR